MIVDSSAILAIFFRETGAGALLEEILSAGYAGIGAPTAAETGLVLSRHLNFGDCLTYATAELADEPLLCLGEDFRKTDLELV